MNKESLLALAKEKGAEVNDDMTKAEIQAAIDALPPENGNDDDEKESPEGDAVDMDAERAEKMGCVSFDEAAKAYKKDGKAIRRVAWLDGRTVDPKHGGHQYVPTEADEAAKDWIIL